MTPYLVPETYSAQLGPQLTGAKGRLWLPHAGPLSSIQLFSAFPSSKIFPISIC